MNMFAYLQMEWGNSPLRCGQSKSSLLHWKKRHNIKSIFYQTLVFASISCLDDGNSVVINVRCGGRCGLNNKHQMQLVCSRHLIPLKPIKTVNSPCAARYILHFIRLQRCLQDYKQAHKCNVLFSDTKHHLSVFLKSRLNSGHSGGAMSKSINTVWNRASLVNWRKLDFRHVDRINSSW